MSDLYTAYSKDDLFVIIKAGSKEQALDIYVENNIHDDIFIEHIYSFAPNAGLHSDFYCDDEGSLYDSMEKNFIPYRFQTMNEEEWKNYCVYWIEKNIVKFWSDKPEFAKEYLNQYRKMINGTENVVVDFSKGFKINTLKKIICLGDWHTDFEIVLVDLKESNYQLISD